jgi:hypothetical protein
MTKELKVASDGHLLGGAARCSFCGRDGALGSAFFMQSCIIVTYAFELQLPSGVGGSTPPHPVSHG